MPQRGPYLEFVYLDLFERTARGLLTEEARLALEWRLIANPRCGVVERGTGGVRKVRVGLGVRGRRGGARVVYLYVERTSRVYLLLVFSKSRQPALTAEERRVVRALAEQLRKE